MFQHGQQLMCLSLRQNFFHPFLINIPFLDKKSLSIYHMNQFSCLILTQIIQFLHNMINAHLSIMIIPITLCKGIRKCTFPKTAYAISNYISYNQMSQSSSSLISSFAYYLCAKNAQRSLKSTWIAWCNPRRW